MNLEDRCSSFFDSGVRQRGTSYFRRAAVQVRTASEKSITATVRGSQAYAVKLEIERLPKRSHTLFVDCSCPYFASGSPCKHIWALIKAADANGWAKDAAVSSGKFLVISNDTGDDYEWWDDEDDDPVDSYPVQRSNEPSRRMSAPAPALHLKIVPTAKPTDPLDWKAVFVAPKIAPASHPYLVAAPVPPSPRPREIRYALNLYAAKVHDILTIDLFQREPRTNGEMGAVKALKISHSDLASLGDSTDRRIAALLLGGKQQHLSSYDGYYPYQPPKVGSFQIAPQLTELLLAELARTNRFYLLEAGQERPGDTPLSIDDGDPAKLALAVLPHPDQTPAWLVKAELKRGDHTFHTVPTDSLIGDQLIVLGNSLLRLHPVPASQTAWMSRLLIQGGARIRAEELDHFLATLTSQPSVPRLILAPECGWQLATAVPSPRLSVSAPARGMTKSKLLSARVLFNYDGELVRYRDGRTSWPAPSSKTLWQRHHEAEAELMAPLLARTDVAFLPPGTNADLSFTPPTLAALIEQLLTAGWLVEAEGRLLRQASQFKALVRSGIDWFDVEASCRFGDQTVELPALLKALKAGEASVLLDDGTLGLLPSEWLEKFTAAAQLGTAGKNHLRFSRPQAALLDILLEGLPEAHIDEKFQSIRSRLKSYSGITPRDPGPGFQGRLRDYQREGLGWLDFLADFGFGGCLADDMGLGKTVQVLALLQDRKTAGPRRPKPSLIVVPRSLVHNWRNEAARFAPKLRVLDLTTPDRHAKWDEISKHNLILTTYGLMRADIELLRAIAFDYCILDEAQAIKNDTSLAAKAARLLQADHRLAMSGTPVENHLGELGSLFAFLNPGMLPPSLLQRLNAKNAEDVRRTAELLAKALRPFILRRTKSQVLKDLPEKTEQTIYCDLDPTQRKLYNDLRNHYRQRLTKSIAAKGVAKSQIEVLEALLRLRQAACHPGLIDKDASHEGSAKLAALMHQLSDVIASGHKALVFSQFTSMLALVKKRLDEEGVTYEYLDGRTRNREQKVERFQTDASVSVFLISLKAGGVGLNLTAAEYCFILDPWWNPAVEAQAIDRAHRMGQSKPVFAYRLIATDTVEEKIMELQEKKRGLSSAILSDDNAHTRGLTLDDVELLLS